MVRFGTEIIFQLRELVQKIWRSDWPVVKEVGWKPPSDGSFPFLKFSLTLSVLVHTLETYLALRQRKLHFETKPPQTLVDTLKKVEQSSKKSNQSLLKETEEKFLKSQQYSLAKSNFDLFSSNFQLAVEITSMVFGLHPYLWNISISVIEDRDKVMAISLLFAALNVLVAEIVGIPFSLYRTFALEQRFGFNKMTPWIFIKDKIKSLLLTLTIGAPVLSIILWVVDIGGKYFFIYLWIFLFCFALLMMTVYPIYIAPLFNKYDPLPHGDLRLAIESLAKRVKFPLTELYVVDGSKRSAHSNAYMYGFGRNKRIVLFDTLINQVEEEELVAILGHELGHWKMGHTMRNFIISQIHVFLTFFGYGLVIVAVGPDLMASFGFDSTPPLPSLLGIMLYLTSILAPVDHILHFMMNAWSRYCEFQADRFAVELDLGSELQTGLCKISLANLGNMNPDKYYSTYHYSHPPLTERLSAIIKNTEVRLKKD